MGGMKGASGSVEYVPIWIRICDDSQFRGGYQPEEKVYQIKDGQVIGTYATIADASRKTDVRYQSIYRCIAAEQKLAGGYAWKKK